MGNVRERALDHKCPNCGAKIVFSPKIGKWKCDNCSGEFDLETLKKFNNASSEENNKSEENIEDVSYVEYHCKNCGAGIIADENTASTFCVYCGNTAILKSKLSGKFAPSKIIPFKKTKEEAIEAFKGLSKGRPLMPKLFNLVENIEKISGVYIPFWLFSINSSGNMKIHATKVSSWTSGDYSYTKTDVYDVFRDASLKYKRIPVDGSTRFDDDIMNTIEPFDYKEMVDYNHAYLSGFLAEKYDVDSDKAVEDAKNRAKNTTRTTLLNSAVGYSSKSIKEENINNNVNVSEYVLLPVWMVNVKYNDKYYTFAMNAQTGEFVGNIPLSVGKTILQILITFIITALIALIVSYIIFLGGN